MIETVATMANEVNEFLFKLTAVPLKVTDKARLVELKQHTHCYQVVVAVDWCIREYQRGNFTRARKLYRIAEEMNRRHEAWRDKTS